VNSVTTTFAYRGDGLRDSRTQGGSTTTFTWDLNRGLPVVLDDGAQYVYGAGLEAMRSGGNWYYYLADGLGSTMAVVDSAGAVQKSYTYDVYGKPTATGSLANAYDFAGQETDATGLQYLRARYMDPDTGTFISRDPLARLPVWFGNSHAYADGNPALVSDPTGLCGWTDPLGCVKDAATAAGGGALDAAKAAGDAIASGAAWTADAVAAIAQGAAAVAATGVGALASASSELARALWYAVRARVNAPLTAMALALAMERGLSCRLLRNGLTGCFGARFLEGSAMTLGNVVLIRDYDTISDDLLDHEETHADQWAMFGLATPGNPLVGQAVFAASYLGMSAAFGPCGNFYEQLADLEKGNYNSCD
jgi:RHS repeat-associated protein